MGRRAPVSLRVNPDVDAKPTRIYLHRPEDNKFGIAYAEARAVVAARHAFNNLDVVGIDCHIGSQLTDLTPLLDALDRLLLLVDQLAEDGITLHHLDIGGGVGIRYRDETPPDLNRYAQAVRETGRPQAESADGAGRSLVGNAGVLLTRVEYLVGRNQALCHRRCGDERPDAPVAVRRPARYRAGEPDRWPGAAGGRGRPGVRVQRFSGQRTASWRWKKARCWRYCRPAPMVRP